MKDDILSIKGRISRSVYWIRALIVFILSILFIFLLLLFANEVSELGKTLLLWYISYSFLSLFMLLQGIKRLHDIGKSGWFILVSLIPIIGGIWLIILFCTDGEADYNKYGPDPKGRILCPNCNTVNKPWQQECIHCKGLIYPLILMDDIGTMKRAHITNDIQKDFSCYNGDYTHLYKGGYDTYEFAFNDKLSLTNKFLGLEGNKYPEKICKKIKLNDNILKANCFAGRFVELHINENNDTYDVRGILSGYNFYRKQ